MYFCARLNQFKVLVLTNKMNISFKGQDGKIGYVEDFKLAGIAIDNSI